jgi:hypothetical protein
MRIHMPGLDCTLEAAADLSAHQFKFLMGAAASGNSQLARVNVATANARVIGILQNKPPTANQGAVVRVSGRSKLVVDGSGTAITVGLPLKATTAGVGIAAASDKDKVGAIALEASSASGDIIDTLIMNYDLAV